MEGWWCARWWSSWAVWVLVVSVGALAHADVPASTGQSPPAGHERGDVPAEAASAPAVSAFRLRVASATSYSWNVGWTLARLGLAIDLLERWTVEVGSSLTLSVHGPTANLDAFVRGGLAWVVADGRDAMREGWTLQALALLGYRYLSLHDEGDGYGAIQQNHCVTLDVGAAATAWVSEHVGLELHLVVGVWVPVAQLDDEFWNITYVRGRHDDVFGDATLSLGLAFR